MTTIAVIGAGHIGHYFSQTAIAHGYDVVIANSRGPETISDLIEELGPQARAARTHEAAAAGEFGLVAIPMAGVPGLPAEPLAGKIVLTTLPTSPATERPRVRLTVVRLPTQAMTRRGGPSPHASTRSSGSTRLTRAASRTRGASTSTSRRSSSARTPTSSRRTSPPPQGMP